MTYYKDYIRGKRREYLTAQNQSTKVTKGSSFDNTLSNS